MQNIRSLCTNSNLGKRRSIQHLTSQWAATTVLKHASQQEAFLLSQLRNINVRLLISNATPRETDNRKFAEVFSTRRRKKLFRDGRGIFNHRRTISHNASSKKSSSFYAECTGKLTSSSTLIRPLAPKTHTTSSLPRTPLGSTS